MMTTAEFEAERARLKAARQSHARSAGNRKPPIRLDCVHLDTTVFQSGGKSYRECLKGHGDICGCAKPQKCGPQCVDYEKRNRP